jgi:pimeloyl-ACP methyl ester carboxylesterase
LDHFGASYHAVDPRQCTNPPHVGGGERRSAGTDVIDGDGTIGTAMPVDHLVMSPDGVSIAAGRRGSGPPLVLIHGTSGDRTSFRFVEPLLEDRFTLYAVDRRGRGASGDSVDDYRIEQEFADIAAVVDSLDGPANVFGHSFGGTVALGAALLARNLRRLILYEPTPGVEALTGELRTRLDDLAARADREGLVDLVMTEFVGFGPEELDRFRASPVWPARVAAAHTIARELHAEEAYRPDPAAFASMTVPTLLVAGSESDAPERRGTEIVHALLPQSTVVVLDGQGHGATLTAPELLAAEIARFLTAD